MKQARLAFVRPGDPGEGLGAGPPSAKRVTSS
jgi:hypothetical protein